MSTAARSGVVIEGKYRLERELGAGGMGSVWLATQLMVDRPVAVKLLHPSFIESDDIQARFEVEAKAIGRLHHPNCITLYDFGFSEDLKAFYTVIEFIDGVSLDKRLTSEVPLDEACGTIRQIAMALSHAHHQGILHRDLKPENVMVSTMTDGSDMVKVLDFGIARIVKGDANSGDEEQRLTKAGEVFGTPAYMSPEQARSTRQLTPAADLYSLGVMFYELVAGGLPFFANSAFDLLMMHVTKPVPPITRPGVPEDLKRLIYKLLEKAPEKRFQSGNEVVTAIDAIELPDPTSAESSAAASTPAESGEFAAAPTRITPPPGSTPASLSADELAVHPTMTDLDSSGSFAAQSGAFAARSGEFDAHRQPTENPTTGPIQVGARRKMVALSVVGFVLVGVVAIVFGITLLDNGDAVADPVAEQTTVDDLDDPFAQPDELELAAGDPKKDAGAPRDETTEPDAGVAEVEPSGVAPDPSESTGDPEPEPAKVTERPRAKPRPKPRPRPRPRPKPEPEEDNSIPELSLDDDDDDSIPSLTID